MDLKKIGKIFLFPHPAVIALLVPASVAFLVPAVLLAGQESVLAIISYVLAAYTLTVVCFRLPRIISFFKNFKQENPHMQRWLSDEYLRVRTSLYGSFIFNIAYAVLQFFLGHYHRTFWYYSIGIYYATLAVMRFLLVRFMKKNPPRTEMRAELLKYRACGCIFLVMNLALSLIVFFMVYWGRTFHHHEIITITMAAYTFTSLTLAIVNIVKYRRYQSPVYDASKAISLAAALVSLLTLETTMLTTFGTESMTLVEKKIMLGASGGAISAVIVTMAIAMIVQSTRKLKSFKKEVSAHE